MIPVNICSDGNVGILLGHVPVAKLKRIRKPFEACAANCRNFTAAEDPGRDFLSWTLLALGALFLISFSRWVWQMLRWLSPGPRPTPSIRRPVEEIAPEALSEWLDSVSEEAKPPPP